jgi:hypothetical protein
MSLIHGWLVRGSPTAVTLRRFRRRVAAWHCPRYEAAPTCRVRVNDVTPVKTWRRRQCFERDRE